MFSSSTSAGWNLVPFGNCYATPALTVVVKLYTCLALLRMQVMCTEIYKILYFCGKRAGCGGMHLLIGKNRKEKGL